MNQIKFACTSLVGTNKVGNLPCDENGYYEMVVGALAMYNSSGEFYEFEGAKELFLQSSTFMRRVQRGAVRGEYGHPRREPGQQMQAFASRVLQIYENMVCCHHREIWLDFERVKDASGRPIISIMSKVQPSGPYGEVLEKQLKNKDENVCFSIRAFTDDHTTPDRVTHRVLRNIVTFDYVNEPGMYNATKYMSPALESADSITISRGEMERSVKDAIMGGVAQESCLLQATELFSALGWEMPKGVTLASGSSGKPAWTQW
jgi:hypothetical protein